MARPDLYGMPETDASKLQGDNDVLRAENARLRAYSMPDDDLNDVLLGFTNYVANERVRSYNQGLNADRERCIRIVRMSLADHGEYIESVGEKIADQIRQG